MADSYIPYPNERPMATIPADVASVVEQVRRCIAETADAANRADQAAALLTTLASGREDAPVNVLRAIKREALTAGSPGNRTSAAAFAHIVRLCIDAGVTEKLDALPTPPTGEA